MTKKHFQLAAKAISHFDLVYVEVVKQLKLNKM